MADQPAQAFSTVRSGPKAANVHPIHQKQRLADKAAQRAQQKRLERLESLLAFEGDLRRCESPKELEYRLANDLMRVVKARKLFVVRRKFGWRGGMRLSAITSLTSFDANAPAVVKLERAFALTLAPLLKAQNKDACGPIDFDFVELQHQKGMADVPGISGVVLPLFDRDGAVHAAIFVIVDADRLEDQRAVFGRARDAAEHAWLTLIPKPLRFLPGRKARLALVGLLLVACAALFIPVPMTALAPVTIVPKSPHVIAAPIDGVVDEILVEPNSSVAAGDALFTFVDTTLRSNLTLAEQKMEVASAKLKTARQNAFGVGAGRRELAVLEAELALAQSELTFAQAQYAKVTVRASRDGVAVFSSKAEWQGKPVAVGERVLEIANTSSVEAKVDLPVSDAIVLRRDAPVRLFLDFDPLRPINARLTSAGYRAVAAEGGTVVFDVRAKLDEDGERLPRIGARGTAQVSGDTVSLGFYVFRRPLSAARQWLGL